ncbi:hypothetical protein Tco_1431663, partial [Tanacetum coccineum]
MENNYPWFQFLALVSPMSQVVKAAWEFVFEIVSVYKVHSSSFLGYSFDSSHGGICMDGIDTWAPKPPVKR